MKAACPLLAFLVSLALPAAATATPLRTLNYHFEMDARGFGTSISTNGYGAVNESGVMGSNARSGSIRVEVVSATQDGGLVVDVTEHIDRELHDMQTVRCAVYGRSQSVICDQNLHTTSEQTVLLQYLGRFFYEPSKVDSANHWHISPNMAPGFTVDNDYTIKKTDGNILTVAISRRESGGGYLGKTDGTLVYDSALNVPDSIKITTSSQRGAGQGDMNVELKLLSDTMATSNGSASAGH